MRLADGFARRRFRYPRLLPTMPDLCVIDVPAVFASPTLPLGRWPIEHVAVPGDHGEMFARSAYTIEVTADPAARTRVQACLFTSLDRQGTIEVVIVPPSPLAGSS